ncbi:MAG: carbamate kinase [Methanobacteriota archaeon]|nr:MAG: carbamate kinase [Euryarchaeota archaeon]
MVKPQKNLVLIALGGNALLGVGEERGFDAQRRRIRETARRVVDVVEEGYQPIITHGNGPQVGDILRRYELTKEWFPPMPLDVCDAESQGFLGYMFLNAFNNAFVEAGLDIEVVYLLTRVVVDPNDKAFKVPTKPIGPYYSNEDLEKIKDMGYSLREVHPGRWRRVVPSPDPKEVLEINSIRDLVEAGCLVIAGGGGGIPVIKDRYGRLRGVEAVVDKDLTSSLIAQKLGVETLLILTDVKRVSINFRRDNQVDLDHLTLEEAKKYLAEGHFWAGSMAPKIEAAIRFLEAKPGGKVVISAVDRVREALHGDGTIITKNTRFGPASSS